MCQKSILLLLCSVLISTSISAQRYRVDSFDIRKGTYPSQPHNFTVFNNALYFVATNITEFDRLYMIDQGDNPQPIKDANNKTIITGDMCVLNNTLYLNATSSATGTELYAYDGSNPPKLEMDIVPGNQGSNPSELIALNNKLYFKTLVGSTAELYAYEPSSQTLTKLSNKYTEAFTGSGSFSKLNIFDNKLFFPAYTSTHGFELFVYNPNTDDLSLVADIYPGSMNSNPEDLIVYNNVLYFTAIDDTHGKELWKYDGVNTPTRLTDMMPGVKNGVNTTANGAGLPRLTAYKDKLLFNAELPNLSGYYLCEYDIINNTAGYFQSLLSATSFFTYGDRLYFSAYNGKFSTMYYYTGTDTAEVVPFKDGYRLSSYSYSALYNNSVYVDAVGKDIQRELFKVTDSVLSIHNIVTLTEATIYPNPTTQDAHIDIQLKNAETIAVQLTDINGLIAYSQESKIYSSGSHTIDLPMRELPTGMYVYKLTDNKGLLLHSGKLLKQ